MLVTVLGTTNRSVSEAENRANPTPLARDWCGGFDSRFSTGDVVRRPTVII